MKTLRATLPLVIALALAACTAEVPVEPEMAIGEDAPAYGVTITRPGPSQHGALMIEVHSVDDQLEYEIRRQVELSSEAVEGAAGYGEFSGFVSVAGPPLDPGGAWFIHLEDEKTVWVYNGRGYLRLHTLERDGFDEEGRPMYSATMHGMNAESGGYLSSQPPPAVLELLPESLLERMAEAGADH
jgi:hypothetical protein